MKYRAILIDPGNVKQERPLQAYSNSRQEIDRWSDGVLQQAIADSAVVQVYQAAETQIDLRTKKGKPA